MAVSWRVYLPVQDTYEDNLLDVYVRDGYNRFARKSDIKIDDPSGSKRSTYTRGTPVQLEVDDGSGYERRWAGFVVDPETSNNQLNVELYGHDLWLRKRNVLTDYDGESIREILKDLIERLTPLKWNDDLVEVLDNQTISINYKGQQLDEVINELSSFSADEYFGATNDREFFFQPTSVTEAPRDFRRGSYLEADFNEDGTREINQVTIYYNDGDDAITVDDREAQNELQDSLNEQENVVLDVTRSFPEVTSREVARKKANSILEGRAIVRTGTLTTWESFDIEPGQETYVEVPEQDVDREMRVAQVEYWWLDDETKVKVAAGGGNDIIDTLVDMSDVVERVEQQSASADADLSRFVSQEIPFDIDFEVSAKSRTIPNDQFLFGDFKSNLGNTGVGGGLLGDQASQWQEIDARIGNWRVSETFTNPVSSSSSATVREEMVIDETWDLSSTQYGTEAASWLKGDDTLQLYPHIEIDCHFWHLNNGDYSDVGTASEDASLTPSNDAPEIIEDGIYDHEAVGSSGSLTSLKSGDVGSASWETDLTLWAWYRNEPTTSYSSIISSSTSTTTGRLEIYVKTDGQVIGSVYGDSDGLEFISGPYTSSGWNLAVLRWDGDNGKLKLSVNGTDGEVTKDLNDFDIRIYDEWEIQLRDNVQVAAAGMYRSTLPDPAVEAMAQNNVPAEYTTTTETLDSPSQPGAKWTGTSPPGTEVTLGVVGSPGTASEERYTETFTSDGGRTLPNWNSSHTDFRLEVLPDTNDDTTTPTINTVSLLV